MRAALNLAPVMNLQSTRIVLVNTTHPGNIGGVARAMKNMGLGELYLVAPHRYPDEQAVWRAAGAGDILERAVVVESLDQALANCQFVVGTSARGRRIPWPTLDPRRCAKQIAAAAQRGARVAVVFGREDRGLTNDELQACNLHLHIPSHPDYTSLNLAMAVQIVSYELRMLALADELPDNPQQEWDAELCSAENLERFYEHLEQTLVEIGFLDPAAPRQLMTRLRRLYGRVQLDEMELKILRGILTETKNTIEKSSY
ncbi:MAG: tRNA (cytosine(32)/uridine(32)-2'-O)-methyltransferase TrmJ [Gammaproteobacteria bacterium]|nr:tRNA (cytosine(32)/uridine(32)-2'-O)-methyltransferase TrmJ [Gammaproteobacteria bacterium]